MKRRSNEISGNDSSESRQTKKVILRKVVKSTNNRESDEYEVASVVSTSSYGDRDDASVSSLKKRKIRRTAENIIQEPKQSQGIHSIQSSQRSTSAQSQPSVADSITSIPDSFDELPPTTRTSKRQSIDAKIKAAEWAKSQGYITEPKEKKPTKKASSANRESLIFNQTAAELPESKPHHEVVSQVVYQETTTTTTTFVEPMVFSVQAETKIFESFHQQPEKIVETIQQPATVAAEVHHEEVKPPSPMRFPIMDYTETQNVSEAPVHVKESIINEAHFTVADTVIEVPKTTIEETVEVTEEIVTEEKPEVAVESQPEEVEQEVVTSEEQPTIKAEEEVAATATTEEEEIVTYETDDIGTVLIKVIRLVTFLAIVAYIYTIPRYEEAAIFFVAIAIVIACLNRFVIRPHDRELEMSKEREHGQRV